MSAPQTTPAAPAATPDRSGHLARGLKYTHEAMVDLLIAVPDATHAELAECFGYSPGWVQRILSSDAFQARLAQRKAELVDPALAASLNDRLSSVTIKALDIVETKLSLEDASAAYALDALGLAVQGVKGLVRGA